MGRKTDKPAVDDDQAPADDVSGDAVADYLRRHPEFFTDRLDLLSDMTAPDRWSGDSVVDIQRFLAERRLGEIDDLRNCAQEVIETSRTNMSVQTRTHAAVLALLSAADLEHLLRIINDDLPLLLDVDVVTLGFEAPGSPGSPESGPQAVPGKALGELLAQADVQKLRQGGVDGIFGAEENVRLLRDIGDETEVGGTLFGAAAGLARSAALARLRPGREVPAGLVALGSRESAFRPGQGTELIGFLARVLESCLHRLVGAPA
jgi:hypothetical protein|tara:strand:- start:5 stop:790 length:786 start_codon:yes stop_codon:yes gene_type:complete